MSLAQVPSEQAYARYGLDPRRLRLARPDALVLHPGPINREVEIASPVADGAQSRILEQVENGVFLRMAVLAELPRRSNGRRGRGIIPFQLLVGTTMELLKRYALPAGLALLLAGAAARRPTRAPSWPMYRPTRLRDRLAGGRARGRPGRPLRAIQPLVEAPISRRSTALLGEAASKARTTRRKRARQPYAPYSTSSASADSLAGGRRSDWTRRAQRASTASAWHRSCAWSWPMRGPSAR